MILALMLAADDIGTQIGSNVGGVAAGGGLLALAAVLLPVIDKILAWRKEQREIQRNYDRERRAEEVQYKQDSANLFREMITEITKGAKNSEDVDEKLQKIIEKIQIIHDRIINKGWPSWKPSDTPHLPHSTPKNPKKTEDDSSSGE